MARIRYTELPLAPHAVEAESLHALLNKKCRNYGFLIDLKSVIGATSITVVTRLTKRALFLYRAMAHGMFNIAMRM